MGAGAAQASGDDDDELGDDSPGGAPRCRFCGLCLSSASSHAELCENLRSNGLLRAPAAFQAYSAVDRADFVPEAGLRRGTQAGEETREEPEEDGDPYVDAAVVLGAGAQLSAPHVHASALDLLAERLEEGAASSTPARIRALDLGSGSGCMSAMLGRLLEGRGDVLAVEHIEELAARARASLALPRNADLLADAGGPVELRCEDAVETARRPDLAEAFDVVHCGAALAEVEPWLPRLLRPGGRAVVPLGPTDAPQWLCTVDKLRDGGVEVKQHIRVLYVPVTTAAAQRERGQRWDEVVERCVKNSASLVTPHPPPQGPSR